MSNGAAASACSSVITRSGTKDWRGTVAFYKRDDAWNGNEFSRRQQCSLGNAAQCDPPLYTFDNTAWTLGGPVLVPGTEFNKNRNKLFFFWAEVAAAIVHVGLAWLLVGRFGVTGSGAAFFGLYVWHGLLIYVLVNRLTGFRWSGENLKLGLVFFGATAAIFAALRLLPFWPSTAFGGALTVVTGLYSLRMLLRLVPPASFPAAIRPWLPRPA